MHAALAAFALAAVTPDPSDVPDPNLVTPGPWGFLVIGVVTIAAIALIWDMMRRVRRGRYRAEIREELDAEQEARAQAEAAVRDSDTDDTSTDADEAPPAR